MKAEQLKAVIYLRVSSAGQVNTDYDPEGYSIPGQREACTRRAELLDAAVAAEYTEYGISGRNTRRPELQRMLVELELIKPDYVIIYDLSRLARNRLDDAILLLQIERTGARLISVLENIDKTPAGRLTHGVLAAVNEYRSAADAEKVHMGMQRKHENGGTNGPATVGYLNVREIVEGREIRTITVDPDRKQLVQMGFGAFATGEYSVKALQTLLDEAGLRARPTAKYPARPLSRSHLHRMLRNDYYVGIVTYGGMKRQGRHQPIIDQQTFDQVQEILDAHHRGGERTQKHHHYLKGSVYCPHCNHRYVYGRHRSHSGEVYAYYGCTGHRKGLCPAGRYVQVVRVEQEIERLYRRMGPTPKQRQAVNQCIDEQTQPVIDAAQQEVARHTARLKELDLEQQKLLQLYYKDGVSTEKAAAERKRIEQECVKTRQAIETLAGEAEEATQPAEQAKLLLMRMGTTYAAAPPHLRRFINRALFERLLVSHAPIRWDRQRVDVVGVRRKEIDAESFARALLRLAQDMARVKAGKGPLMQDQWKAQEARLLQIRSANGCP